MAKAVTRHRRPMHIIKQKLLAVTQYIPPKRQAPGAYPPLNVKVEVENGLLLLLKRNVQQVFQESQMIAVVQNNGCTSEDMLILKRRLRKHGLAMKFFPNQVMRSFLKDSPYCNMATLFQGPTALIVSKQGKAKEMLSTLKGSPQMVLLGACIDNTLMTVQGIQQYSRLPAVTVIQGELVSGLTLLTSRTSSLLSHHPATLAALLQQYVKQQEAPETPPPEASEAAV